VATLASPKPAGKDVVLPERTVMEDPTTTGEGFLLLNSGWRPIFFNRLAAEILTYPQKIDAHHNLTSFLTSKIRSTLFSATGSSPPALVSEFRSGRRRYLCHAYRVATAVNGNGNASLAVILARSSPGPLSLGQVSDKFHLTTREQEVLKHLLMGHTTKEIATGMEISPHTVKAFLRMIMMKMGVSTRSGVVGKAFITRL
jgi:DNA-binding CsgD family transcriptional regulator